MTTLNTKNPVCIPSTKLLGDFWTLRIVDALSDGPQRFSEIERTIGDTNTATLSARLKKLEDENILERTETSRAEVRYQLTKLGKKAIPVLKAVNDFSRAAKRYI